MILCQLDFGKRHQICQEKVQTLVIATRELHGIVMDPEHVTLAWCVRFAGQIITRTVKGADGLTAFQRAFRKYLVLRSEQEEDSDHGQIFGR